MLYVSLACIADCSLVTGWHSGTTPLPLGQLRLLNNNKKEGKQWNKPARAGGWAGKLQEKRTLTFRQFLKLILVLMAITLFFFNSTIVLLFLSKTASWQPLWQPHELPCIYGSGVVHCIKLIILISNVLRLVVKLRQKGLAPFSCNPATQQPTLIPTSVVLVLWAED